MLVVRSLSFNANLVEVNMMKIIFFSAVTLLSISTFGSGFDCLNIESIIPIDISINIDQNNQLRVSSLDRLRVISEDRTDPSAQKIKFKSGFLGASTLSDKKWAEDEVIFDSVSKTLTYKYEFAPRNEANQRILDGGKLPKKPYEWVITESRVVMNEKNGECYVDRILDERQAVDSTGDKKEKKIYTDVVYDSGLCTKIDDLKVIDGIPLDKCTEKLKSITSTIHAHANELKAEGLHLNLGRLLPAEAANGASENVFRAVKILEECQKYTRPSRQKTAPSGNRKVAPPKKAVN